MKSIREFHNNVYLIYLPVCEYAVYVWRTPRPRHDSSSLAKWPEISHEIETTVQIPHPLRMGIKFTTPWKTLIIKSPPPQDEKGVKCVRYARRGDVEASIWPTHYLAEEICLSSGHIAKCDSAKFSIWKKTLKIAKYIKDAVVLGWDRQIFENSSLTIGITAATVSACQANVINLKNDQFEDIWNNLRNLLTFTLSLWTDETVTTK